MQLYFDKSDNMSDLFPQKSVPRAATASKADKEQQLDIAEDILAQERRPASIFCHDSK